MTEPSAQRTKEVPAVHTGKAEKLEKVGHKGGVGIR